MSVNQAATRTDVSIGSKDIARSHIPILGSQSSSSLFRRLLAARRVSGDGEVDDGREWTDPALSVAVDSERDGDAQRKGKLASP